MAADVHVRPAKGFVNPAVRPGSAAVYPGVGDWAVDKQLAELGRVLNKRIGGLVAAGRARLRRRLAVGRAEARDLGAARDDGVAVMSLVRWRPALGRDVR